MSWGDYHEGQGDRVSGPASDLDGRTYNASEPSGYVSNDPYAPPDYTRPGYAHSPYAPPYQFTYDAAHPPRPSVSMLDAIKLFFKNYAVFHGRASRSEYWWVYLAGVLLWIALIVPAIAMVGLAAAVDSEPGAVVFLYLGFVMMLSLGLVVPTVSLQVRRLHDAGFSGFFALFAYVPYLNYATWLVPVVMSIMPSKPEGVKYDTPNGSQPVTV